MSFVPSVQFTEGFVHRYGEGELINSHTDPLSHSGNKIARPELTNVDCVLIANFGEFMGGFVRTILTFDNSSAN